MEVYTGHGGYMKRELSIFPAGDDWAEFQKISRYLCTRQKRWSGENSETELTVFGTKCVTDKDVEMSVGHILKSAKCGTEEFKIYPVSSGVPLRVLSKGVGHAGIQHRMF